MKIALCLERFDPALGGQAIWTRGFAAFLRDAGHDVHVLSCVFGDHGVAIQPHEVPWCWSPLTRARRFGVALRALAPDVVHDAGVTAARGIFQPHTGSDLHSLRRLIATESPARRLRAALSPKMRLLQTQMRLLETRQMRDSSGIVAVSPLVGRMLAARYPKQAGKIETIMNGVDTTRFSPEALAPLRAAARRTFAAGDDFVYLAVAHNTRLKGIDTALRALAGVIREGTAARLLVAGGTADPPLLQLAHALGVADRVTFLGQIADIRPVYAAADALIHPTRWDACSLVVLEALACGLPLITSSVNGAVAAIRDGESGLVLEDPEDATALGGLMRTVLAEDTARSLAAAARRAALAHDLQANFRAVEQLLSRTAVHPSRGVF